MEFDPPGPDLASERVVLAVAGHTDTDPLELPCLFDVIDPEALDAFIRSENAGQVQFGYAGCTVTVHGDGTVDVAGTSFPDAKRDAIDGHGQEYAEE